MSIILAIALFVGLFLAGVTNVFIFAALAAFIAASLAGKVVSAILYALDI